MKITHLLRSQVISAILGWFSKDMDEREAIALILEAFAQALRKELQDEQNLKPPEKLSPG